MGCPTSNKTQFLKNYENTSKKLWKFLTKFQKIEIWEKIVKKNCEKNCEKNLRKNVLQKFEK